MTTYEQALTYAAKGWHVLPVGSNKVPVSGYGLKSSTSDPDKIQKMWRENPAAGVAVACEASGLVVLDCDPRNGGFETLKQLCSDDPSFAEALDSAPQVDTQGGGRHFYFLAQAGTLYPGSLGPGLDIKHRGYVVAPPSKGMSGQYSWGLGKSPWEASIAVAPPRLSHPREVVIGTPEVPSDIELPSATQVADLRGSLFLIPSDDRDTWVSLGMALKTAQELGRELWMEWSAKSGKFDEREASKTWDSFHPRGTHWKVVFSHVQYAADVFVERLHVNGKRLIAKKAWAPPPPKNAGSVLDAPIIPFTEAEANAAQLHPRMLVKDYLFADLRNLIAAGGIGKTTMLVHEAIQGALGRPIWRRSVEAPFTTVIITKEDSREILIARLKCMMDQMALTAAQRETVFAHVWAVDLAGENFKLAEFSGRILVPHFANLDKLVLRCKPLKPDRIIFDPLMSFSAGEGFVNDAEQAIVEASRYLMRSFPGCAVDIVHHTGKGNARAGTTDQYSGRNGSALPDGSRMVAVLIKLKPEGFYEATGIQLDSNESGLMLSLPKLSYCAEQSDIYIRRRDFLFEAVDALDKIKREAIANENKAASKNATLDATRQSLLQTLAALSCADDPRDRYPSITRLLEAPGVIGKSTSRKQELEQLLAVGAILECSLSDDQIAEFSSKSSLGGRMTYLALPLDSL
jgi:RecA-family ATPase